MKNSLKLVLCALLTFAFAASPPGALAEVKKSPVELIYNQTAHEFNHVVNQSQQDATEFAYYANVIACDAIYFACDANSELWALAAEAKDSYEAVSNTTSINLSDHPTVYAEKSYASWLPRNHVLYLKRYGDTPFIPPVRLVG